MGKRIFGYDAFLESALVSAIAEAKISFTDDFRSMLVEIDTPVAKALYALASKDVDVNTNYLGVDTEKDGFVTFLPDDKVEKIPYRLPDAGNCYLQSSVSIGFKDPKRPSPETDLALDHTFTLDEILDLFRNASDAATFYNISEGLRSMYSGGVTLSKVSWDGHEVLVRTLDLTRDLSGIRQASGKVGKVVKAILDAAGKDFGPVEIEDFVNKYKSVVKRKNNKFGYIEVVSGEDIRKCYNESGYYSGDGTLGTSCMRFDRCQDYLDIYVENPSVCSLVVLKREGKVTARALLWTTQDGRRVMDRIYTNDSSDTQLFKDYAKANGIWYKLQQNSYTGIPFVGPEGQEEHLNSPVVVKPGEYDQYPYMDTFKFYSKKKGELYPDEDKGYDYELVETNGGNGQCGSCGGTGRAECGNCDGRGETTCSSCDGVGEVDCSTCDGEGKEECNYCAGNGDNECSTCDGSGKLEGEDGEDEDCPDCGGEGREKCGHCDGEGSRECGRCEGSGMRECRYCSGNGEVECEDCGGYGEVDCPDCS